MLQQRRVLIGIGGGIAAFKVCSLVSSLYKEQAQIRVAITTAAQQFITPLTVATLSRHRTYTDSDFWQPQPRPLHIELGEWAEAIVIAPLTANTLGKLAWGLADNLLTNTVLASSCPILLAPAMNTEMWEQKTVQRNWELLLEDTRYWGMSPGTGLLACDRLGSGRMAEPEEILTALRSLFHTGGRQDLTGKRILISAGGTREFFDAVRFIGNPSTGKMGLELAKAALYRGATVTLVSASPVENLTPSSQLRILSAVSAEQMHRAMVSEFPRADWTIMAAAVADVKPANRTAEKLPKQEIPAALALEAVPDIVADLSQRQQPHQKLIGFAAQTGDILTPAKEKLQRKGLDAIVANPIDIPGAGFGSDTNQAIILDCQGRQQQIPSSTKFHLAHQILDFIQRME